MNVFPSLLIRPLRPLTAFALTMGLIAGACDSSASAAFDLTLRGLARTADGSWQRTHENAEWQPQETAVVICDMWDYHHCRNATLRVGEMAPRMNQVVAAMRDRGALVVHAPSSCMDFYQDHPARQRAQAAPIAANLPDAIESWCNDIPGEEMSLYPIDQSDGGEDDDPQLHEQWASTLTSMGRNPRAPWKRQIDTLTIDADQDIISDQGDEIWNVMEQRGIKNVLLVGVHTNMCVLGRPFGLRQMSKNGRTVALMRDMTDTMYNPARSPYVAHYRGTDLIVEHIEKYVAPTVTSDQILGGEAFSFKWDVPTKVVIAIAEREYQTWETLPALAQKIWTEQRGYAVTVIIGDAEKHDLPGLTEALKNADVLVLSIRRQALPPDQLQAIRHYLAHGKPLIAIRTSSHAFHARGKGPKGHAEWADFDAQVLGGNYQGHFGNQHPSQIGVLPAAAEHPILSDVALPYTSLGSLYKNNPLGQNTTALVMGTLEDGRVHPVAWTHRFGKSKVFYTSLGHTSDFQQPAFERLLWNAMEWLRVLPSDLPEASRSAGGD